MKKSDHNDHHDSDFLLVEPSNSALESVYSSLKHSIMRGEFSPGQTLKLRVLAVAFNTSHMPVREALNRLLVARAVETAHRRSMRIPFLSADRARQILRVRLVLEGYAVRAAAEVVTDKQIAELRRLCVEMERLSDGTTFDMGRYLTLNYRFHFFAYGICGNDVLLSAIEACWLQYGPLLKLIIDSNEPSTHHYHYALIDALVTGNADEAEKALRMDLNVTANNIFANAYKAEALS